MSTKMESASVCSAIPSSSSTKKRGISRLSFRRLFYTSPLINRPRISSRNKNTSSSVDVRAESSSTSTSASEKVSLRQEPVLQPISIINDVQSNSISTQFLKTIDAHYLECPLCLTELPIECFPEIATCSHRSCIDCLQQYLKIEITESRVNISCPECTEPIHPTDIRMILNNEILMNKYEEFMLRRVLVSEPDARWCPAPDCSFAVIASGCASCPKLKCERPGCHTYFCYHCKQEWHPNQTCDAARAQRSPNVRSSSVSFSQESAIQRDDIKPCPRCQVLIVKMDDGSCNHMTCAVCGSEFCWLCMKEISDLHYLSPSGCTFWGKKPWSRKKKILWQLGTLVGAPVGIGLVAGIAVPAMIIGIPVWVGRKLHARYEHASKHKRNLAITGGVTASILVSPILAGLAVGIGVPILLAYVYGVVPISLCRSGGCGVTTSASGVRIEFDDEADIAVGTSGHTTADAQSVDTSSHRVANPSIGEVSFGMSASLSMGSGSHLERVGLMRDSDRESASNTAIAGASLTGSVTSSMVGAPGGQRLEVQADVASNKRFSFSSETASATVSLSERSATMSLNDDASTKALAGSILGYRDNSSTSCTPVEVHVDASGNAVGYSFLSQEDSVDQVKGDVVVSPVFLNEEVYVKSNKGQRFKYRSSAGAEKQLNCGVEGEDGSIWSAEDAVSERVRFDENVSFIDDQPIEEASFSGADSGAQPILQLVNSASWPDNQLLREGTSSERKKHSDWCHTISEQVSHPETINEVWAENSTIWSALAKKNGSRSPTPPNGTCLTSSETVDLRAAHQGSTTVPTVSDCKPSRSQLSLPLSTDADCTNGMSWTTHQSLPCILDTEPTLHPVMADLKQI